MPQDPSTRDEQEQQRLEALYRLAVLDTPRDDRLDGLLQATARRFEVPIALLSLVDAQRVWFKSTVGIDVQETPREHTFCGLAVHQGSPLIVPDTLADPRWATNPYVVGPPHVRFYAGAPVRAASGHVVGTLCLIDTRSRTLDSQQQRDLVTMADFMASELIVRQSVMAPLPGRR